MRSRRSRVAVAGREGDTMRSDIVPGATFPDYELPDHTDTPRTLSELQGDDPMVLTLAAGTTAPRSTSSTCSSRWPIRSSRWRTRSWSTIATDAHHTLQEFRASVGAQWTFLSDPGRIVQRTSTSRSTRTPRTIR